MYDYIWLVFQVAEVDAYKVVCWNMNHVEINLLTGKKSFLSSSVYSLISRKHIYSLLDVQKGKQLIMIVKHKRYRPSNIKTK